MISLFKRKKDDFEDLDRYEEDEYYDDNYDDNSSDIKTTDNDYYEMPEIIKSYSEEDIIEMEDNKKKYNLYKRIISLIFTLILVIIVFITVDVIAVSKYNVGPFFAIRTNVYKDGGTKVYYGIGYKVIKYHQVQGRRDTELGTWSLKYNTEPIDTTDIDLSIEFENDYLSTSKKYYKKFVRLSSTIKNIDKENNKLVLEYFDEDNKYTLKIYCNMANKVNDSNLDIFEVDSKVYIIGSIEKFSIKNSKYPNSVYLNYCFAEYLDGGEIIDIE